jgi:GAF domain-containing protein
MRATTVRFSEDLWALLEAESSGQGISAAQFVRDATIMRLGMLSGARGDRDATHALEDLAAAALARHEGSRPAHAVVPEAVRDPQRVAALHGLGLLDTPPEPAYDRLTRLAQKLLQVPIVILSLVAEDRQFFKSAIGLPEPFASRREVPLTHSICQYTVAAEEPLLVTDARRDARHRDSPAIPDLDLVAYAGVPLIDAGGHALGTLCVIDHAPRRWTLDHVETLEALAASAMTLIELQTAVGVPA